MGVGAAYLTDRVADCPMVQAVDGRLVLVVDCPTVQGADCRLVLVAGDPTALAVDCHMPPAHNAEGF